MVDASRRNFFRGSFLKEVGKVLDGFEAGVQEAREKEEFDRFFESYESSYALTLAYPDDILLETARQYGIETEGREKKEIVKELMVRKGGY